MEKLDVGCYIEAITLAVPKVQQSIWIEYFKISARQLALLAKASSHLKSIRFEWCDISLDEQDQENSAITFSDQANSTTEYLGFKG
mmetsp:Transcript_14438/g.16686  ORF Transcript_14438/g.16686 Transcript_14438/m.16686 type:complete len:86 (-) Transcript_14438:199-456(-)